MDLDDAVEAFATAGMPPARQCEGLQTLQKLIGNIVASPHEEKFRRVKKTNPTIQQKLFPQCLDILRGVGFQDSGEFLVYSADVGPSLQEALVVVESLLLSLGEEPSSSSSAPKAKAAGYTPAKASTAPAVTPQESKRSRQEESAKKAKAAQQQSQANSQDQLAALRRSRANGYREEQDVALARHLSSSAADTNAPYDTIASLNASRGATHSFISCTRCGMSLRYNSAMRAQAVLCPCGMLLQPTHLVGQAFHPASPSDLPVEPGEPVDADDRPRQSRGPTITVRGPDGTARQLPLHSVLQMVRQQEERQTAGAQDQTIEALPTRVFEGGPADASGDGTNCQICMENFEEGEELRTLPCFHLFHSHCVDQWLKVNSICPTCRHKIG